MLLWHGSRLSNWVGILSQGLRIAPPEAPVTGYMVCVALGISGYWGMVDELFVPLVWERCVLCGHVIKECQLLLCLQEEQGWYIITV